ncbi:MAG TPA: alkaline phosphatase PhoX, partial [Allocoleopsis sp.]
MKRRNFLMFLGAGAGTLALQPLVKNGQNPSGSLLGEPALAQTSGTVPFRPIQSPLPLKIEGLDQTKQLTDYSKFTVVDDLVLPEGYTYQVVASWGDPVGDARFGYNNDYLSLIETGENQGYLTVNHEYISAKPWSQTYEQVMGKALPFAAIESAVAAAGDDGINAFALPDTDPVKAQIKEVSKAALEDLGLSVLS